MKKICRVKPRYEVCKACVDAQLFYQEHEDCTRCSMTNKEYELVSFGAGSFWSSDYAMVQADGRIYKVPLSDVYDIRDVEDNHEKTDIDM